MGMAAKVRSSSAGMPVSTPATADQISSYGLLPVARFRFDALSFVVEVFNHDISRHDRCVYAFVIGNEVVRIGSSKAPLYKRLRCFERDITNSLSNKKSPAPLWEAQKWLDLLQGGEGTVYARQGSSVTTPIGSFYCYLDEESILIGRCSPCLNRNKHR
jgi:hypothetical protein